MTDVSRPVMIVTGATGALGGAVARRAQGIGARLVLPGRSEERLVEAFGDVGPDRLLVGGFDQSKADACASLMERALARFGRVDAVLNSVGGFAMGDVQADPWSAWERMIESNVRTAVALTRAALPSMRDQGRGRIVHVGAHAGLRGGAGMGAYAASKAALMRLVESAADEVGEDGVTVNAVLPTIIDTPSNRAAMPDADPSGWVSPEAIADVMLFLASEGGRAVNGALIPVGGHG